MSISKTTIGVAFASLLAVATLGSAAAIMNRGDTPSPPISDMGNAPPPPAQSQFIDHGEFHVEPYDDRALSPEQKAADPSFNPRWVPFAECLAGKGYEVRDNPQARFTQEDMDRLVARLNRERPDKAANRGLTQNSKVGGIAGAFLQCSDHLTTPAEDLPTP